MPKAILEWSLPEEQGDYDIVMQAHALSAFANSVYWHYRNLSKHGDDVAAAEATRVLAVIRELLESSGARIE